MALTDVFAGKSPEEKERIPEFWTYPVLFIIEDGTCEAVEDCIQNMPHTDHDVSVHFFFAKDKVTFQEKRKGSAVWNAALNLIAEHDGIFEWELRFSDYGQPKTKDIQVMNIILSRLENALQNRFPNTAIEIPDH